MIKTGSVNLITNANGAALKEYSFDPWGRRRNPDTWTYNSVPAVSITNRGFTMHSLSRIGGKHMDPFDLINMNGRVYDPVPGQFLSPDPFIGNAASTMSYNRYAYCSFNPLKYVDPSGYNQFSPYDNNGFNFNNYHQTDGSDAVYGYKSNPSGGGASYGGPGYELNGFGEGGIYYDWYSGTYRSTIEGNPAIGWNKALVMAIVTLMEQGFNISMGITNQGIAYYASENFKAIGLCGVLPIESPYQSPQRGGDGVGQPGTWESLIPKGGGGLSGLSENDFINYSIEGLGVWAGTIQSGFEAAKKIQPIVNTWIKGAKALGKTSNILGVASIGYDFATGTANSSTIANGIVLVGSAAAVFFGGVALAPWVAGAGVIYGIISISGGDAWLDRNFDISNHLNLVKPKNP